MAASVAKAAAALGLFALHGVEASPASGLGPDARRLQSFDSNAAARQIDYSNPNYGRDHTPGGDWDLMEQVQSGKAYKSADYERSLQGLTAEFTGLWLPTGVAQDGQGHVIISQKTGLVVIFDVATAGYFGGKLASSALLLMCRQAVVSFINDLSLFSLFFSWWPRAYRHSERRCELWR
jgi:hypothetical protein